MTETYGVKRNRGQVLESKERQIGLQVFCYTEISYPKQNVRWVVNKSSTASYISRSSVFRIQKEAEQGLIGTPPLRSVKGELHENCVGYEVFTEVVMKSIIFWDMMPCIPLSFNRRFGGTSPPCVPPKRRLKLNGLHGVISQKMILFLRKLLIYGSQ
jgi:hypothetical protein